MFVSRAASRSKFLKIVKIQKIHISLIYNIYHPLIYTRTCHTQRKMALMKILKVPWLRTKKKRFRTNKAVTMTPHVQCCSRGGLVMVESEPLLYLVKKKGGIFAK